MSSILKWMIVLLLLLTVAGGGGVYWCYVRSDEMLRVEVLKQLQNLAPDLKFVVERANFDFNGRIRLQGLAIQLPGDVEPALYIPETIATLDEQQLTDFEKISILRLRFVHPQLHAVRERDGRWNWQGINWVRNSSQTVPDVEIEHGTIVVELQRERRASRKLKLTDLNIKSVPSAARKVTAVISTRIEPAGPLTATIEADLGGPPFTLEAKWLRLPVDDDLLDLIGELSSPVNAKLQELRQSMANLAATQVAASAIPVAAAQSGTSSRQAPSVSLRSEVPTVVQTVPGPIGLKCSCDLHCRLEWNETNAPLGYQVLAELSSGQFSNVLLPFPLYEIHGSVFVDPQQIIVRDLRAENGVTRLYVNARVAPNAPHKIPVLKLQLRNAQIDEPLKARLPEPVRKLVNSFALTGLCDLDVGTSQVAGTARQPGVKPVWEADLRLTEGTLAHEKFSYPVEEINGTVRWRGNKIEIHANGKASGVPVSVKGWVLDPGPTHESEFIITGNAIPVNDVLLDSSPAAIRKALVELDLQGKADIWLRFGKTPGAGRKYQSYHVLRPQDCSCSFKGFPYRIEHLKGLVIWDEDLITFKGLQGTHDETQLTAEGRYLRAPAPGRLDLAVHAKNAAFDRSLEAALPASIHRLWQEFQPNGRFDVETLIAWVPGQPCQVALPVISVKNAEITMQSFPWPLQAIDGEFSYEAPVLQMKSVTAQHDDTQLRGRGVVYFPPGEPWRVKFDELHVDDLIPNSTFRKALPAQLRNVFDVLNPAGKFSVSTTIWEGATSRPGAVLFSGGNGANALWSGWDVQLTLVDSALTAGIRVDDIHGRVDLKGTCDGKATKLNGKLDLDSVSVFREASGLAHQISRVVGPISLEDGVFVGGSRVMAMPVAGQTPRVNLPGRISGEAIDGTLTIDVSADLRNDPDYSLLVTLSRGRLESYARQYLRGQSNLAGIMNGWMHLWGKGKGESNVKGRGELQIAPAALYELPVFVKMFQALRFDAGDSTAFDQADIRYNIEDSRYNFDAIHLKGTTIDLVGRGYVRFDGGMQFDFYSMLARNRMRIPLISDVAGFLSRGWVGVQVTGNVGSPQTRMVPVPEFDDVLKQLLGTFEQPVNPPRQNNPRSATPRTQPPIR